jgi:hypothetical protein
VKEIKSSRFTQNALENLFSQTDSFALKPSAAGFLDSLRSVTVCQTMIKPIRASSYDFDEQEKESLNFLDLVMANETNELNDSNVIEHFMIPEVTDTEIFTDVMEYSAFYLEVFKITDETVNCNECRAKMLEDSRDDLTGGALKSLRTNLSIELSSKAELLFLKLEYLFRKLESSSSIKESFKYNVQEQLAEDCQCSMIESVANKFFKNRLKKTQTRLMHSSNKYASKSLR